MSMMPIPPERPRGSHGNRPVGWRLRGAMLRCGTRSRSWRPLQKRDGRYWNWAGAVGDRFLPSSLSSTFPFFP
jgi:hypothetical protein